VLQSHADQTRGRFRTRESATYSEESESLLEFAVNLLEAQETLASRLWRLVRKVCLRPGVVADGYQRGFLWSHDLEVLNLGEAMLL